MKKSKAAVANTLVAGNQLAEEGRFTAAIQVYHKVIQEDPSCAMLAWCMLASCHSRLGNIVDSRDGAMKCLELNPTYVPGYLRLAWAQEMLLDFEDALETLERGLSLDSTNETLIYLKERVLDEMKKQHLFQEVTVSVPESAPRFLGGFSSLGQEALARIPAGSAYARFPRDRLLPPLKKKDALIFSDEKAKLAFETIYNGEFKVRWYSTESQAEILAYLPDDPHPVFQCILKENADVGPEYGYIESHYVQSNPTYNRLWSIDQKKYLAHRFLREHGIAFAAHAENNLGLLNRIACSLEDDYGEHGMRNDLIDIRLVAGDIMFLLGMSSPHDILAVFAQVLERTKKHAEAAEIYLDITNGYFGPNLSRSAQTKVRSLAAAAYERAKDSIMAEREYIGALRAAGKWSFQKDDFIKGHLGRLIRCYTMATIGVLCGEYTDDAHRDMWELFGPLTRLLETAGFPMTDFQRSTLKELPALKELPDGLKQKYRSSPKRALQALVNATNAPSMEEYRQRVRGCIMDFDAHVSACAQMASRCGNDHRKQQFMREYFHQSCDDSRNDFGKVKDSYYKPEGTHARCHSCSKAGSDSLLLVCPCKTAAYCNKQCQRDAWWLHKQSCTWYQEKKEQH
jgi:tetratricopeptide (TPR) repeat protein